ncbi:energy transducer TonB [Kordia sp. YSTF-M3]|uniref:Energy transducer TonB n=1 Tax=Kordia aestuariivivens TaxID=2759037 RepID=A0ABR7Q3V6_9FLAO|nr:energy transducer TonB [Kordia aestuariivivens]MBC8753227.1 energy transducer TonB [Kordia aestuariivivens]
MIHKKLLTGLLFCLTIVLNAQTDAPKKPITAESTVVKDCQYEEEIYECSREKLQRATFAFLTPSDVLNVAKSTKQEIIFVNMSLATDNEGKIVKERSSLKFHETEMKALAVEPTTPLEDFQIELAPVSQKQNSYIASHLFLKIDRENNIFIPLYDHIPERVPFSGPEIGVIYPGCQKATTNKERKRCMAEKISAFVGENFNTRLGKKLKLDGIIRIYVVFKINEQGKAVEIRSRAPHPELEKEAIRVVRRLPRMQPAAIEGVSVNVSYTLPIVFKIKSSRKRRKN